MATVVFFDSYPITRAGFMQMISQHAPHIDARVVGNLDELAALSSKVNPDMIILTVNTPKEPVPSQAIQRCRAVCPFAPVVLYDEDHQEGHMDHWLRSGVAGYLLKSEPNTALLQCMEIVLKGGRYLSPDGWARYLCIVEEKPVRHSVRLGRRELEVARYLSAGKSTSWIASKTGRKPSTISTIKKRIFHKLNVDNVVALCSIIPTVSITERKSVIRKLDSSEGDEDQSGGLSLDRPGTYIASAQ